MRTPWERRGNPGSAPRIGKGHPWAYPAVNELTKKKCWENEKKKNYRKADYFDRTRSKNSLEKKYQAGELVRNFKVCKFRTTCGPRPCGNGRLGGGSKDLETPLPRQIHRGLRAAGGKKMNDEGNLSDD